MFSPSQSDVRRFFCQVYAKTHTQTPAGILSIGLQGIELMAAQWIEEHPEYHADLIDEAEAQARMYEVDANRTNPFLHLSMHLSINEQYSIDQPLGIRQVIDLLAAKRGALHLAHHEVMEELGAMIWQSQRSGRPPDGDAYMAAVRRRATRD
jgi:Domain of unknown function (DUF1841)